MPESQIQNSNNIPTPSTVQADSKLQKFSFNRFLGSLFGWKKNSGVNRRQSNVEFVKVDVGSNQRVSQAFLNQHLSSAPLSTKLDALYTKWLSDNTDKTTEIAARMSRLDQLQFMIQNDPYASRAVALYADEATQLDSQDTLINIETPDPRMTRAMYQLLNLWGLTQTRIRGTFEQIASFGDAFWANKITENGVEKIIPIGQRVITDRLEFSPSHVMEQLKKRNGAMGAFASNNYLIDKMLGTLEDTGEFADLFDSKLFGFVIDEDTVVPPWCVTHFRFAAEGNDFFPWGTSPILGALTPWRQTTNAIALQQLAQSMNFPVQLYEVKTNENMSPVEQLNVVNLVRESYDNIGVNPNAGGSEVYTVNTKIWAPEGLIKVTTLKAENGDSNADDIIKLYQEREALGLGLPAAFFGEEGWWGGVNKSGKALMQQWKPFGRKCFSMQSAFLEGLADLFRIHFAITGQYDFRTPFTLSMKYPAEEVGDDKFEQQNASLEQAQNVIAIIKTAIGAGDEDQLPPDIIRDIITKYTFLDPADITKWTRDAQYASILSGSNEEEDSDEAGDSAGLGDLDLGSDDTDLSTDLDLDTSTDTDLDAAVEESNARVRKRLREKQLTEAYNQVKSEIYFQALKENAVNNFIRRQQHVQVFNQVPGYLDLMLETFEKERSRKSSQKRMRENLKKNPATTLLKSEPDSEK